jgi:hypothetical protein
VKWLRGLLYGLLLASAILLATWGFYLAMRMRR